MQTLNNDVKEKIKNELCDKCKIKIEKMTKDVLDKRNGSFLQKTSMLVKSPRIMENFFNSLCPACKTKVKKVMRIG